MGWDLAIGADIPGNVVVGVVGSGPDFAVVVVCCFLPGRVAAGLVGCAAAGQTPPHPVVGSAGVFPDRFEPPLPGMLDDNKAGLVRFGHNMVVSGLAQADICMPAPHAPGSFAQEPVVPREQTPARFVHVVLPLPASNGVLPGRLEPGEPAEATACLLQNSATP